jgi:hypothetical protein
MPDIPGLVRADQVPTGGSQGPPGGPVRPPAPGRASEPVEGTEEGVRPPSTRKLRFMHGRKPA